MRIPPPQGMLSRFQGAPGKAHLLEALTDQVLVAGKVTLAQALARRACLEEIQPGVNLTTQDDCDTDIFFILTGRLRVCVNSQEVAQRGAGEHVGEMALIDVTARRSATLTALEPSVVARVTEQDFTRIAKTYPDLWRRIAVQVAKRLRQRACLIPQPNDRPVVFVGSSTEGLSVAERVHRALRRGKADSRLWTDGVFQASTTSVESLLALAGEADFAALVMTADDVSVSRSVRKAAPRDNVVFELGLFMGSIGRERTFAILAEGVDLKIPSDLLGVTFLRYPSGAAMTSDELKPVCKELLRIVSQLGPK